MTGPDPALAEEIRRLRLERALLASRLTGTGDAERVGISSNALVLYGVGEAGEPLEWHYPWDRSDLDRCERTYESSPAHVQERMLPLLEKYRRVLRDRMRGKR